MLKRIDNEREYLISGSDDLYFHFTHKRVKKNEITNNVIIQENYYTSLNDRFLFSLNI